MQREQNVTLMAVRANKPDSANGVPQGAARPGAFSAADCSSAWQMSSTAGGWADGPWRSLAVDGSVAGVAPAWALAGALAKASAQAISGPAIQLLISTTAKRAGLRTGAAVKP